MWAELFATSGRLHNSLESYTSIGSGRSSGSSTPGISDKGLLDSKFLKYGVVGTTGAPDGLSGVQSDALRRRAVLPGFKVSVTVADYFLSGLSDRLDSPDIWMLLGHIVPPKLEPHSPQSRRDRQDKTAVFYDKNTWLYRLALPPTRGKQVL